MLIVDTGVIVAAADKSDRHHRACAALLENERGPLVTTGLVVAECAYLLDRELGPSAEALLYESIIDEVLRVEQLLPADWVRVHSLVVRYADMPLGGTDASLIAIAERLGERKIATLDARHFTVVRPAHTDRFDVLP